MNGWLFGCNLDCSILEVNSGKIEKFQNGMLYINGKNKFEKDCIKHKKGILLEGYITNKFELQNEHHVDTWEEAYDLELKREDFPKRLRGSFCGLNFSNDNQMVFSDHIGSKALFFYYVNDILVISTKLKWIVQVLQHNRIKYTFNETAAQYMLTYGFMLDDSSFISEIKRVLPGNKLVFHDKKICEMSYYIPTIRKTIEMSENEAIQLIDKTFKTAVKREFEKDKEYGYAHLVDLSGGLDSRMVTWVAHELGYIDQTNISYCKTGYLDYHIAAKIAKDLKHKFYFKQLDDFQWIKSIEEILVLGNGEALYSGITGGNEFFQDLNCKKYGIEHTGMLGDVVIACFAKDKNSAYSTPQYGIQQYSTRLHFSFSNTILDKYENQEIFNLYIRGFMGAMSTYAIRQNYFEVSSPFLDVDFLNTCLSLPIKYRINHNIYLKWIKKYYHDAANYGWEKWAGVCPKKEFELLRDCTYAFRKFKRTCRKIVGLDIKDNMNPLDYWYDNDIKSFFDDFYNKCIGIECFGKSLREDINKLFMQGNVDEKTQALTVLGMAKLYFG